MTVIFRNTVIFMYKKQYKEFTWMPAKLITFRKLSQLMPLNLKVLCLIPQTPEDNGFAFNSDILLTWKFPSLTNFNPKVNMGGNSEKCSSLLI